MVRASNRGSMLTPPGSGRLLDFAATSNHSEAVVREAPTEPV